MKLAFLKLDMSSEFFLVEITKDGAHKVGKFIAQFLYIKKPRVYWLFPEDSKIDFIEADILDLAEVSHLNEKESNGFFFKDLIEAIFNKSYLVL